MESTTAAIGGPIAMPAVAHADVILSNVLPWSGIDIQFFE